MSHKNTWKRHELMVAFNLYCQLPFGKLHSRNPNIIKYAALIGRTPSALAMKLTNIASLDPVITSSGRKGLKGASLKDREMWDEMELDWRAFAEESEKIIAEISNETTGKHLEEVPTNYLGRTKSIQTEARIGQQFFRKSVLSAYNGKCCISGLSQPNLLVASHIIPWKDSETNRLNPRNGLALSMLHDKAFDLGMLTIDKNMKVVVSKKYFSQNDSFSEKSILHFDGKAVAKPEKFSPDEEFLAYHREHIFENKVEFV